MGQEKMALSVLAIKYMVPCYIGVNSDFSYLSSQEHKVTAPGLIRREAFVDDKIIPVKLVHSFVAL